VLEGNFRAQEEAARTIGLLSLVSLALVFAVLRGRYRSTALALVVMGNIPLALVGSVAALWIAGLPLSVASMVGFVTLAASARATHPEGEPLPQPRPPRGRAVGASPVLRGARSGSPRSS
jgi:Cu/Ag efflux pump CusA